MCLIFLFELVSCGSIYVSTSLSLFVCICVHPLLCMSLWGSCIHETACDFMLSPVYSNAGGLESMTSNFQTLPLCLSTLRLLKQKKKTLCGSSQHIAQQNKSNCKVEFTSPQERNKQVPQESQKSCEYGKLISSDHFHPPPRQSCVSIKCFCQCCL